jgi:hypothetical protein
VAILVDDNMPLQVKHTDPDKICLKTSKDANPYKYTPIYTENTLQYTMCIGSNIRDVHVHVSENYRDQLLNKPDYTMMRYPIFTTWSYFFKHINQQIVLEYATEIHKHNYTISQLEIDGLFL